MNTDLNYLLNNLIDSLNKSIKNISKIRDISNKEIQLDELKLFSNISSNINNLSDETEELLLFVLDKSEDEKTAEEKSKIRNIKINNKVQKILLPYMIYLKIVLENNNL